MKKIHYIPLPIKLKQLNYTSNILINFIPKQYIECLLNNLIPKIQAHFIGLTNQEKWANFFHNLHPHNNLGYVTQEVYLLDNNLTSKDVIKNSIKYVFESLEKELFNDLVESFSKLLESEKVYVLKESNQPISFEILNVLTYLKNIQSILKYFPRSSTDYKGSAYSSKYKSLAKSQINHLDNRLNHTYFPLKNDYEIKKTKELITLLKKSLDKETDSFPEQLNFINVSYGLDSKVLDLSEFELEVYNTFLNFYNGSKTKKSTLLRSVGLFIDKAFNTIDITKKDKAQIIYEILEIFFNDEIKQINKENKKRNFSFNATAIGKDLYIKTTFEKTPIYYHTSEENFLTQLLEHGFKDLFYSSLHLDKKEDNNDDIQINKDFVEILQLTELELKTFTFFFLHYDYQQVVGKLPLR